NSATNTVFIQPTTGRVMSLLSRFVNPVPALPIGHVSRKLLGRHRNRPSAGVLASTLGGLAIGQPLDSVKRLSVDLLSAPPSPVRPQDSGSASTDHAQRSLIGGLLIESAPNTSILPELDFSTAPDFELALGEYGLPLHGLTEQLSTQLLPIPSQASTHLNDSHRLDPPQSETGSASRSQSNESGSEQLDAQPPGVLSKDFALQPIPIEQSFRPLNDAQSTSSSSPPLAPNRPLSDRFPAARPRPMRPTLYPLHRCDSPSSITSSFRALRPQSTYSLRKSVLINSEIACNYVDGACTRDHDCLWKPDPAITVPRTRPDPTGELKKGPSRRILIVGSTYARGVRRTATMFSVITLDGIQDDKEYVKHEFKGRGYSVESMVNDDFTRDTVLNRVARFHQDAQSGDVRAVVFTGHAWRHEGGPVMLIPPNCPTWDQAISEPEWEANIREHTRSGVIVFSILAHCFSGDFMRQQFDLRDAHNIPTLEPSATPGPVFVTFSSTSGNLRAYESSIEHTTPFRIADHFLYALVSTMHSSEVQDWDQFFPLFEQKFREVRAIASRIAEDGEGPVRSILRSVLGSTARFANNLALNWPNPATGASRGPNFGKRWDQMHPQLPCFSASQAAPFSAIM
ncbi:hypothetical protein BDV93DRAFT_527449, partial [Ceratobasidium sp. AG-I]